MRLVQAVVEADGDQREVPAREAEDELGGVADVEDGVASSGRAAGSARRASRVRTASSGTTSTASRPMRDAEARHLAVDAGDEAAVQRGGDVVGVPLELGGERRGRRRRARRSSRRPAGRRRRPRRWCRGRPTSGTSERDAELEAPRGRRAWRSRARTGCAGRGRCAGRSATPKRPVSTTSTSTCSDSAAASTSKPGPEVGRRRRDADERGGGSCREEDALDGAVVASQGTTEPACDSAVCGSLRPWPVSTQTTRPTPSGTPCGEQPRDAGGRRRLAEDALVGGEEAVGVEDLLVGDRADGAAGRAHRAHRLLPARGVADADRARDRLRVRDRRAVHQRRGARRLPAEHPRRLRPISLKPFQ